MDGFGSAQTRSSTKGVLSTFDGHFSALKQRMKDADTDIFNWGSDLRLRIDAHVDQQRSLLQQYYRDEHKLLVCKEKELLQLESTYQREHQQLDRLLEKCRSLKLELFTIEYDTESIPFVKCMTPSEMAKRSEREARQKNPPTHFHSSAHEPSGRTAEAR